MIYLPEHHRQKTRAYDKSGGAAHSRSASGIEKILTRHRSAAVAERLKHPVLGALLADHSRYGRYADKRGDKKEEKRKHFCHARNNVYIVFKTRIAHI